LKLVAADVILRGAVYKNSTQSGYHSASQTEILLSVPVGFNKKNSWGRNFAPFVLMKTKFLFGRAVEILFRFRAQISYSSCVSKGPFKQIVFIWGACIVQLMY